MLLAQGAWDAIAKLENALAKLDRDGELRLTHYRTGPREQQRAPAAVPGRGGRGGQAGDAVRSWPNSSASTSISVEQLHSTRYRAMQTGADMF